tara:strand:+ start:2360 stop:3292 length:933 start_codon:yes stop_codon:yes gene_type:complete
MNKIIQFLFFFIYIFSVENSNATSIEIKIKISNEIITNMDIENEKKYLTFLNPKFEDLEVLKKNEVAKNSLITEIIKKNELAKNYDLKTKNNLVNIIEKNFLKKKNIKSKSEFLSILEKRNINYEVIKKKIEIEGLWNQFIYKKYIKNVKINKKELKDNIVDQLNNQKTRFEYNLSEIVFSDMSSQNMDLFLKDLYKSIKELSFENSAGIYSISNTSKNGGLIGWVSELQISNKIKRELKNISLNEFSKPIKINNVYIILKLNEKRQIKQSISVEDELKKSINKETNRQLNSFSDILYKKLKMNTEVYEF